MNHLDSLYEAGRKVKFDHNEGGSEPIYDRPTIFWMREPTEDGQKGIKVKKLKAGKKSAKRIATMRAKPRK